LTGAKEILSNEDIITLALTHKAKKGDVNAYKALMDSAYGGVKTECRNNRSKTTHF
jgi:hypothetical protein